MPQKIKESNISDTLKSTLYLLFLGSSPGGTPNCLFKKLLGNSPREYKSPIKKKFTTTSFSLRLREFFRSMFNNNPYNEAPRPITKGPLKVLLFPNILFRRADEI